MTNYDQALADRAAKDSEDARNHAIELLSQGRLEYGAAMALFAVRAARAARGVRRPVPVVAGPKAGDTRAQNLADVTQTDVLQNPAMKPTTARCGADEKSGFECHAAIYFEQEPGVWRHINPALDSRHTPQPL